MWQPIETAPTDGTELMLWAKGMHEFADTDYTCNYTVGWYGEDDFVGWLEAGGRSIQPTHWHPLPAPPNS